MPLRRTDFPSPLYESETTEAQSDCEIECEPYFVELSSLPSDQIDHLRQTGLLGESGWNIQLLRQKHTDYLSQVWKRPLSAPFVSLDASRPWILYWCLHGCDILAKNPSPGERLNMVGFLESCWSSYEVTEHPVSKEMDPFYFSEVDADRNEAIIAGGFGGGPSQLPHAATTYAAILSLCILATSGGEAEKVSTDFLKRIRIPLYRWMMQLLDFETGAYHMHVDGEADVRASYTIICCASLLGLDALVLCQDKVVTYVRSCQTYEGGIGGEPWSEAHGGYTYCGVAALEILDKLDVLDVEALTGWLARRQMPFEGGFAGRSNKLVDGCYSFWQGAAFAIVSGAVGGSTRDVTSDGLLFDTAMLERYILLCAQDVKGGLRDKPSKSRDFYHSCYNLSGLSVAQNTISVEETHLCFNIRKDRVMQIQSMQW